MKLLENITITTYEPSESFKSESHHLALVNGDGVPLSLIGFCKTKSEDSEEVAEFLRSIAYGAFVSVCIEKSKLIKINSVQWNNDCLIKSIKFSEFERIEDYKCKLIDDSIDRIFKIPQNEKEKTAIANMKKLAHSYYDDIAMNKI